MSQIDNKGREFQFGGMLGYGRPAPVGYQIWLGLRTVLCMALLGVAVNGRAGNSGTLTDGREILQKSFSTYLHMSSYYGRANTDSLLLDVNGKPLKQTGTSVEMKYKRPNKLLLSFTTPVGSRIVWSNSKDLGVFDPSTSKYSLSPTAPTLETMLPLLFQRASVTASFDPLYALSRDELPGKLDHITLKGLSTYNGHPVYIVTAELHGKRVIDWTWCIDRNSLLLYKIEQVSPNLEQKVAFNQDGQTKYGHRKVNLMLRTVVADAKPNAPLADKEFDYKVPATATQRIKLQGK